MSRSESIQNIALQNTTLSKSYSKNATKNVSSQSQSDEFSKVLSAKKDEQKTVGEPKARPKVSKDSAKKELVKVSEDQDVKVDEQVVDQNNLNELSVLVEDLINILQTNNIIDEDKLIGLIEDFESGNLSLDELQGLIGELELVNNEELNGKLLQITELVESFEGLDANVIINKEAFGNQVVESEETTDEDLELKTASDNEIKAEEKDTKESFDSKIQSQNTADSKTQVTIKGNSNDDLLESTDADIANINNIQVDGFKEFEVADVSKTAENLPKSDMNLFNQVIEGVKLNISEDVSEMFIKMKPDNLGKLSMQIVMDRGMLVARFEVESQMVKETLESNLDDLRNALSDKGFEIQEFDVSVDKDSDSHDNLFQSFGKRKSKDAISNESNVKSNAYQTNLHNKTHLDSTVDFLA